MTIHNVMPGFLHALKMLNQMIKFAPNMADTTKPIWNLLRTKISELGDMLNRRLSKKLSPYSVPIQFLFCLTPT